MVCIAKQGQRAFSSADADRLSTGWTFQWPEDTFGIDGENRFLKSKHNFLEAVFIRSDNNYILLNNYILKREYMYFIEDKIKRIGYVKNQPWLTKYHEADGYVFFKQQFYVKKIIDDFGYVELNEDLATYISKIFNTKSSVRSIGAVLERSEWALKSSYSSFIK